MNNLSRSEYLGVTGIYMIKSTISDNLYIGSSSNLYKRINEHIRKLNGNRHHNLRMQNFFNKYGEECLEILILEKLESNITTDNLHLIEQSYLNIHFSENCFNSHKNVNYFIDNPSAIKASSDGSKKNWKDNYDELKLSVCKNLIKAKEEFIRRVENGELDMSSIMKGRVFSDDTRERQSRSAKARGRHLHNLIKTYQYDLDGNFIKEFQCIKDAAIYIGNYKLASNINECINGKRKSASGYIWKNFKT